MTLNSIQEQTYMLFTLALRGEELAKVSKKLQLPLMTPLKRLK